MSAVRASKIKLLFSFFCAFSSAFSHGESQKRSFDYHSQLGIASGGPQKALCLKIRSTLQSDDKITLVFLPANSRDTSQVRHARVIETLNRSCSENEVEDSEAKYYRLQLLKEELTLPIVAIGVAKTSASFVLKQSTVQADLNGDGKKEFFKSCASQEGLHFTVWNETPLQDKALWHAYYHLGYDTVPNCTEKETIPIVSTTQ